MNPRYLEVSAKVRYWEDSEVNGVEDANGELMPHRAGDLWVPKIDLDFGQIIDWPGVIASIHYKVCDAGEYWLLDENMRRIAKYKGRYVPNSFLCHGDNGFGDYIIFDVDAEGLIKNYRKPFIEFSHWDEIA